MYERSSEMADDSDDKTRAEGTKRDDGRSPATVNGMIASPTGSQATEGRGSKRGHEDGAGTGQETITNGASYEGNGDESPRKRQRLSNNAAEANVVPTQPEQADVSADAPRSEQVRVVAEHNGTAAPVEETLDGGGLVSPKLDDDVEEGEVKA